MSSRIVAVSVFVCVALFSFSQTPYLKFDNQLESKSKEIHLGQHVLFSIKGDAVIYRGYLSEINTTDSTVTVGDNIIPINMLTMLAPPQVWKAGYGFVAVPLIIIGSVWASYGLMIFLYGIAEGDWLFILGGLILDHLIPKTTVRFLLAGLIWPRTKLQIGEEWKMTVRFK